MKYEIRKNDPAYLYAKKVVSGKVKLSCEKERLACERHLTDLSNQGKSWFPYVYDHTRAERIWYFFSKLKHIQGCFSGQYIKLEEFQYFDLGVPFGWVREENGLRRFSEVLDEEGRGSAKSTKCSGISLYGLTSDCYYPPFHPELRKFEYNPQIYTIAIDRDQANIVRNAAMHMANYSDEISKRLECKKSYITNRARGGFIKALSKEVTNLDGLAPLLCIADEWGAWKTSSRLDTIRGGMGKVSQSLVYKITTASDDASSKPAKVDYDYCCKILTGAEKNENYFVMIRELDEKDDPHDLSLYGKANPFLRDAHNSYSRELAEQIKKEHDLAYGSRNAGMILEFLIKRANRWQVASENKYLTSRELEKLRAAQIPRTEFMKFVHGRSCICGIDASKRIDITAEAFVFQLEDGKIAIYPQAFLPSESIMQHKRKDKLPYDYYIQQDYCREIEGELIDHEVLKQYLCDFEARTDGKVKAICLDEAWLYQFMIDADAGRMPNRKRYDCISVPQTTTHMNEPCELFVNLILQGKLVICENELFVQHCENAYAEYDHGGRRKVAKKDKDSPYRIDLLQAALNGLKKIDLLQGEKLADQLKCGKFSF